MKIVSQDKKEIINLDNVTRISIMDPIEENYKYTISADTNSAESKCWDLGYYKTEKRAKEVLQEMMTRYKNWENMKAGQPSGLCLPVYEMPKE